MGWRKCDARDVARAPGADGLGGPAAAVSLERLASVEQRVKTLGAWDDRMGSAIHAAWHWRLVACALVLIVGVLVYKDLRPRTDILPYLYVVDVEGTVLWEGVPGSFTLTDVQVLNRLEDWLEWARSRTPDMPTMRDHWTKADKMTAPSSEAKQTFAAYMDAENPLLLSPKPRVRVQVTGKRVKGASDYRLTWTEERLGTQEQVLERTAWEGDFTVELKAPQRLEDTKKARYGLYITKIIWGPVVTPVGW